MSGNVKKSLGKVLSAEDIINKILSVKGITMEKLAAEIGYTVSGVEKAMSRDSIGDKLVRTIHDKFGIPESFLRGNEKELIVEENNTSVQKDHALKEKSDMDLADAIRIVIEGSEYYVIPKVALEGKYRLMPLEEISIKERELARRNDDMIRKDTQIQGLYELIKLMASGVAGNSPKVEDTQKNTGV